VQLDEVAGGWIFRTNAAYAPFVRDLSKQKPARLSRAQIETLAILAYRQPVTRPEIDDIRGVDCGPVLKVLLERDLVRMLGRKDEPGRPVIYGTTTQFLEFFGLKSLKDLPTLREFTDLNEESRRTVERELGETLEETVATLHSEGPRIPGPSDTLPPNNEDDGPMNTEIPPAMPETDESDDAGEPVAAAGESARDEEQDEAPDEQGDEAPDEDGDDAPAAKAPVAEKKPDGELDPEEEFPDDDDDDFDDDDDEDEDEDEESDDEES
jgi:segregation and condensation protein B